MAKWLVNEGDRQFAARDFEELKRFASQGAIGPGAMIQPPGSGEWIYASEVPGVRELLRSASPAVGAAVVDSGPTSPGSSKQGMILMVLGVVAVACIGIIIYFVGSLPKMDELKLLGGKDGLALTEMIVTEANAPLRPSPDKATKAVLTLKKESRVKLLAKRGPWYHVEAPGAKKGWVEVDNVVPGYYYAGAKDRENLDPIYNPDRYLFVKNSSWMGLPDKEKQNVTLFQFQLQNKSKFNMSDIVLLATIKDKNGNVLEKKEIPVEGVVRAYDGVPVGTLRPPEKQPELPARTLTYSMLEELGKNDPDVWLLWSDGVEVAMASQNYVEANIELIQANAIPREK